MKTSIKITCPKCETKFTGTLYAGKEGAIIEAYCPNCGEDCCDER